MIIHTSGLKAKTKIYPISPKQIQPNAVDLTIDKVWSLEKGMFMLDGDSKHSLPRRAVHPIVRQTDGNEFFRLKNGTYLVVFEQTVQMGPDEAGIVVCRSTLMRNGVWMTSALYDSGYRGHMHAGLTVAQGIEFIFPRHERLAQFLCFEAEALRQYDGIYQEALRKS